MTTGAAWDAGVTGQKTECLEPRRCRCSCEFRLNSGLLALLCKILLPENRLPVHERQTARMEVRCTKLQCRIKVGAIDAAALGTFKK